MLPPYYAEPQFRLIEGEQPENHLREIAPIKWDAEAVRRLKRETARCGNAPTTLCLGRLEADAFSNHLQSIPGAGEIDSIDGLIYEGLEVQVIPEVETALRVVEVLETPRRTAMFPPSDPNPPIAA